MKEFLKLLLFKGISHLSTQPRIGRTSRLLALCLVFFFSGCLFGGKKETEEVVTAPQSGQPAKASPTVQEMEKPTETYTPPEERQELYDDILSRLTSLERDYQFLKDKVSMQEFLIGEATKESQKIKEEVRAELEKLRAQLAEYNALVLRILNRVSK